MNKKNSKESTHITYKNSILYQIDLFKKKKIKIKHACHTLNKHNGNLKFYFF